MYTDIRIYIYIYCKCILIIYIHTYTYIHIYIDDIDFTYVILDQQVCICNMRIYSPGWPIHPFFGLHGSAGAVPSCPDGRGAQLNICEVLCCHSFVSSKTTHTHIYIHIVSRKNMKETHIHIFVISWVIIPHFANGTLLVPLGICNKLLKPGASVKMYMVTPGQNEDYSEEWQVYVWS